MFRIVLVHPEIPPNTGNVIRLAANTGSELHLIEPLGFAMEDRLLRRAGLDYHEYAAVQRHASWAQWLASQHPDPARCFAFTTRATTPHHAVAWQAGDWLVFGSESAGGGGVRGLAAERLCRRRLIRLRRATAAPSVGPLPPAAAGGPRARRPRPA